VKCCVQPYCADDLRQLEMSITLSPISPLFRSLQTELDGRHDKYERLVKLSRDITVASKRIIFSVHRISRCG